MLVPLVQHTGLGRRGMERAGKQPPDNFLGALDLIALNWWRPVQIALLRNDQKTQGILELLIG